jgi:hypothetical protein
MTAAKMVTIPVKTAVIDAQSGEVVREKTTQFAMLPIDTRDGQCPECGVKHADDAPHNAQSLAYQYRFFGLNGFWPNWGNALAHCDEATRQRWTAELIALGVDAAQFIPAKSGAGSDEGEVGP